MNPAESRVREYPDNPQVGLLADPDSEIVPVYSGDRIRLSMRAKLGLGILVVFLPPLAVATWLAWGTPFLWKVWACGLLSFGLGQAITSWAARPLSNLSKRARSLAGVSMGRQRWLGLIRTDPPSDEAISTALDKIEKNVQEIQALNRIGQLVACEEDLGRILSAIADEAVALLRADAGLIGVWDAESEVFRDVAACNMPVMFPGREFGVRESLTSQVAKSGKVIFLEDYSSYPCRIKELERFRFRGALGVPLMVGRECRGAVVVLSVDRNHRFTARDGHLLATFASQAGAAFEKARLYKTALDQLEELTHARKHLVKQSQELERALSNIVRVQEEERSRIAADVHDGVVQMMVGSLCELQAAMAHFPHALEVVEAKQKRARALIRDSITELRRVIFDLRPTTLDAAGLVPAVESLVEDLQQISDVRLDVCVVGTLFRFPAEAEIGAYRIIQEALNNAVKHSDATFVEVNVRFADELVEVVVRDDGRGFPVEEATSIYSKKAGLIGMRERARSLGGKLSVSSTVGQGTTVTTIIPCKPRNVLANTTILDRSCPDPLTEETAQIGKDDASR